MKWLKTYSILSDKRRKLKWSENALKDFRSVKLRNLVRFAYDNSPFYRKCYDQYGVRPDQIHTEEDIQKLPLLEKTSLQQTDPLQVITVKPKDGPLREVDLMTEVTSGSTGEPLKIKRTWSDLFYIKANDIRAFQQTGFRLYHRQVVLKSSTASITGPHWFERFGILRKYWLSVTDSPEHNLAKLKEIRPDHLHGYPSGLLEIAELLRERHETFTIPIVCTGAEVMDQHMRQQISTSFKADVFDLYGTREVGNIAWECRAHQGLHINDDSMIIEVLNEDGHEVSAGVEGDVVVTHLDSYDYPFIRYRLGDRALRLEGMCSCGVHFSRLKSITGRDDARIRLPSGRWITGMVFQELRTVPWLSAFRIVQDEISSIRLQLVPRAKIIKAELDALTARTSELVQGELTVVPEVVNNLERGKSGKLRAVVCKLPLEHHILSGRDAATII
jgi:phenylacetate-CoA ligase